MRQNVILLFVIVINVVSCHNNPNAVSLRTDTIQGNENINNKIGYSTPENLIDQFYLGLKNNQLKIIANCLGRTDTNGLVFKEMRGLKYKIINKELINNDENAYRKMGDYTITIQAIYNENKDTLITTYDIRKMKNGWIIIGYSSEVEDKMEEDIQALPDSP